jgi:hypothetical protein
MNNNINIFDEYKLIGQEIDNLFQVKYKSETRLIQFVYYGYFKYNPTTASSEASKFVLIDTKLQTFGFCQSLMEAVDFLQLEDGESSNLRNDILKLIEKEERLRNSIEEFGFTPKIVFNRKLKVLLASFRR